MIEAGTRKAALPALDLLVRGALSGAILGIATHWRLRRPCRPAFRWSGSDIPVGFVMIVLLNLELVTGSFAVLPMAQMDNGIRFADTLRNWAYSYVGNLIGSLAYAVLAWGALTMFGERRRACGRSDRGDRRRQDGGLCGACGAGWAAAFAKACCATGWCAWAW